MFTWEVTFRPDLSIEGRADDPKVGTLRAIFDPAPGKEITVEQTSDGTRIRFYGTLRLKSIPGAATSWDIPTFPKSK